MGKRQWPQQHRLHDAKHGRASPDAKREREHGHGAETRVLQQLAEGEAKVIHNAAPPSDRQSLLVSREASTPATRTEQGRAKCQRMFLGKLVPTRAECRANRRDSHSLSIRESAPTSDRSQDK